MNRTYGRAAGIITAASMAVGLPGCWAQGRYDAAQSNWNRDETRITPANVDDLVELWSHDLGDGRIVSPLSVNGAIYVVSDELAAASGFAFTAATGDVRWQNTIPPGQLGPGVDVHEPVWFESQIVVPWGESQKLGGTRTFDPDTGAEVARAGSYYTWGLVQAGGQLAEGATTYSSSIPVNWWFGVGWRCNAALGGQGGTPAVMTDMAFVGDNLLWGEGNRALGYVGCPTGATTWTSTWSIDLGGAPKAVVGIGTTHAAYLDVSGTLTVLDVATGAVAWAEEVGSAAPPAVADGRLILRLPDGRVAARDAVTGTPLWATPAGAATGAPLVGGDVVYVPSGNSIATFTLDGAALDPVDVGSPVALAIVDDGRLIATTTDSRIVVFGL